MKNVGGIPALLRLLRKSIDAEIKELVTGKSWIDSMWWIKVYFSVVSETFVRSFVAKNEC